MRREAYELANELNTELEASGEIMTECPGDLEMKRYKENILSEIKKEKKSRKSRFYRACAAACAALALIAGTALFGDEVHAAIRQISWNISAALGISEDLEDYKEVVNTSVSDNGYVITLQEAVVSEETLTLNYTVQREDGKRMDLVMMPSGSIYVNGKYMTGGAGGSADFLDEEQKILGIVMQYYKIDMDPSCENEFRIIFDSVGTENVTRGKWSFAFTADGADLMADTKRLDIGREFELPDGVKITVEEFTANELEQRIYYRISGPTDYIMMVKAVTGSGEQVEFGVRTQDGSSGYMQNEEIIDDGRLDENAGTVTMTLYALELPKESGRIGNDYVQVGEPFEIEL